jgi:hypothetical protein
MNCRKVSRKLSAYIEGDLTPAEIIGVEEHLRSCAQCRRRAADIRLIKDTATQLDTIAVGPHFNNRLMCAISSQADGKTVWSGWRSRLALSGVAFVVAAALTFLLVSPENSNFQIPSINTQAEAPARLQPDNAKETNHEGFPVPEEVLRRDMELTENPKQDSIVSDSVVLPKHYVQPVGVKKNKDENVVF